MIVLGAWWLSKMKEKEDVECEAIGGGLSHASWRSPV